MSKPGNLRKIILINDKNFDFKLEKARIMIEFGK